MANLTRYNLKVTMDNNILNVSELPITDGVWVKFDDIKELLNTSTTEGCVICGCRISLKGYCAGCQTRID